MFVRFLPKATIEAKAEALLADFGRAVCPVQAPPVPIDDIVETQLRLTIDFDDLSERFGIEGVLEATWARTRQVFVDESLDPEEHPHVEGRYNYTLGHVAGHWELHHPYLSTSPCHVCRASATSRRLEYQADYFASCLLMPRSMVLDAWGRSWEQPRPTFSWTRDFTSEPTGYDWGGSCQEPYGAGATIAPLFHVSVQAMQIRLEELGLVPSADSAGSSGNGNS